MDQSATTLDTTLLPLLNEMEALRRLRRLYPPEHPALPPARERVRVRAASLPPGRDVLLGFSPDGLIVGDRTIPVPPQASGHRLLDVMFRLGIAAVRFMPPRAPDGAVELCEELSTLREPPGEADRKHLLDRRHAFPGIDLIPVDTSRLALLEDSEVGLHAGQRASWSEILAEIVRQAIAPTLDSAMTPAALAALLETGPEGGSLLESLFPELVRWAIDEPTTATMRLAELRAFLAELLGLLAPERRSLVITALANTASPDLLLPPDGAPLIAIATILEAAEFRLQHGLPITGTLATLIERIVSVDAIREQLTPDLRGRAAALLTRIGTQHEQPQLSDRVTLLDLDLGWQHKPWAAELRASLEERATSDHLALALVEAWRISSEQTLRERAAERLAVQLTDAVVSGEFDTARRRAATLATLPSPGIPSGLLRRIVASCIGALATLERSLHNEVVALLGGFGAPIIPAVLDALADANDLVIRKRLMEIVLRFGSDAIPTIRPLLEDQRWYVVRNAVFLLRRLGDPELGTSIKPLLDGAPPQLLGEMLKALAASGDPEWFAILFREVDSVDEERARIAVSIAGRITNPEVSAALADRLRARIGIKLREPFSIELLKALERLHDPIALPVLREILALKQWRYPFTLSPLRAEAAAAVARIDGQEARQLAARLRGDSDPAVVQAVTDVAARGTIEEEDR